MEILSTIGKEVISRLSKSVLDVLISKLSNHEKDVLKTTKQNLSELFELHMIEIIKWASNIPFLNLNIPKETKSSTIELSINTNIIKVDSDIDQCNKPNKEQSDVKKKETKRYVSEIEFMEELKNSILVGYPGSGKTTTIKRLILEFFLNTENSFDFDIPILIRLRNLEGLSVSIKLLEVFDIPYEIKVSKYEHKYTDDNGKVIKEIRERIDTYVGKTLLNNFIPKFLNSINALLLLDGLDEIQQNMQSEIMHEIEEIGLKLSSARIILTVRSSTLIPHITNFTRYEINPLTDNQIKTIAKKWIGNEKDFLKELERMPYNDIANRPIFLTLLMILYSKSKSLPQNPYEVYQEATYLILKDWDDARNIYRASKYKDFNSMKKLKFLSEISYWLTYKTKMQIFSSIDLQNIYKSLYSKYNLPAEEMNVVIAEIESHNGLIIESSFGKFEFSHLSFQEYLCATHIVSMPFSQITIRYLNEYPEPLAIAICLSSEPSMWFANLIINSNLDITDKKIFDKQDSLRNSLYRLVSRLTIESPVFDVLKEFGDALLFLLFSMFYESWDYITVFMQFLYSSPAIIESINLSLFEYEIESTIDGVYRMERIIKRNDLIFISQIPDKGDISSRLFQSNNLEIKNNKVSLLLPTSGHKILRR